MFSKENKKYKTDIKHIAFIMDGNGRWAKKRLLTRSMGHKAGVDRINEIFDHCYFDYNIKNISLFIFSCENWKRSKKEIDFLFELLKIYFEKNIEKLIKDDAKIQIIGNLNDERIPKDILSTLKEAMNRTKHCKTGTFNLLFNYGGMQDIVQATKKITEDVINKKLNINDINLENYSNYLYTKDLPKVDLLVRTSGEERISNCYLYQIAYAELAFPKAYWPDFNSEELDKVIGNYNNRNRRFGGIKDE